ncbi:tripartite tricarboxylate transporter substrate binding protein [Roseococcus sp. SDR]|uniref:Bug family tripartite tricarboxylate transporter substrate binding protein n=1 Tax=Roseococcus sp. SDR TaxID=2835532 RepID=UPI001BD13B2D|nr:tripartite tricarboxylate transporter substrate binding protein [Roseococcus sp. SDR]MBS7788460.1 tripartite tricarboxylate transporter substrate binding protein [Roseococcus sp. SDR]MBV1843774.1 tripartite tricarboxylate transporter substrate binding protein [Roseococcus sp. SDR]
MKRRALLAAAAASPLAAQAQTTDWPRQPMRMILPFASGGVTDLTARLLAPGLQHRLGQPVIIEGRTGAGGTIAAEVVARATDGHTLFSTTGATNSIAPALFPALRYDPVRDFQPISFIARVPHVVLVNPASGITNVQELIALLRREPGRHNYVSTGAGSITHLAPELFLQLAGVQATHVPTRGSGPAILELLAGRVTFMIDALAPAIGQVQQGSLRAIGAGTKTRIPNLPELVPVAEQGLPEFESYTWAAIYMTAGAPPAVVQRLHAATVATARDPDVSRRFFELGYELVASTPEELARIQQEEFVKWGAVIRRADIKPES